MDGTGKVQQDDAAAEPGNGAARPTNIDIMGILGTLPQRYPFLMVDRVIDIIPGKSATGIKNVTVNEEFFQGHFPHYPVMPGVLMLEAFAQTGAMLAVETLGGPHITARLDVFLMSVESAKFRRPVIPGDQLYMHVTIERHRGTVWRFYAVARVDQQIVAEARFTFMTVPRDKQSEYRGGA